MVSKFTQYSCIPGMLIFGTSTVVVQKIIFSMSAAGRNGEVKKFEKPWFQTEAMFVGMMLCLVVFEITQMIRRFRTVKSDIETGLIEKPEGAEPKKSHLKQYVVVLAPAMCDMVATCMMNVGLVWIQPSIWQMLRGSMIIFSSIMVVVFLKQKLYAYNWFAVSLTVVGLIIVAVASMYIPSVKPSGGSEATSTQRAVAITLVVTAQIIQASQIVIEQHLLKNVDMEASLIVGIEGLWGMSVLAILMVPLGYTPKGWAVFHEDTIDSFIMMGHSSALTWTVVLYVTVILFYNLFGMMVTQVFTAVHRTILEAVRTSCIWVTNLVIHYGISKDFGELWCPWSFLELFGFVLILTGTFIYNKIIRLPGFKYPEPEPEPVKAAE